MVVMVVGQEDDMGVRHIVRLDGRRVHPTRANPPHRRCELVKEWIDKDVDSGEPNCKPRVAKPRNPILHRMEWVNRF